MTNSTLTRSEPTPYTVIDDFFGEVLEEIQETGFCPTLYAAFVSTQQVERPHGRLPEKYMAREYLRDRLAMMMQITISTLPHLEQSVMERVREDLYSSLATYQEDSKPPGPLTELLGIVHWKHNAIGIESVQDIEPLFRSAYNQAIQKLKVVQEQDELKRQSKVKTVLTNTKNAFVIFGVLLVALLAVNWMSMPGTASSLKPAVNSQTVRRHAFARSRSHSIVQTQKRYVHKHR